jgi:hypothetical protein
MEITQEYHVDYASQRMVIVMGEIGICLKGEVGMFSSLLPGTIQGHYYWTELICDDLVSLKSLFSIETK